MAYVGRPHPNPEVEKYLVACQKAHYNPLQSVIDNIIRGASMPKVVTGHQDTTAPVLVRLINEINLLSGRVEIQMRLLARIIAKMDPAFIEDPTDPEVKRRSDLLTAEVIKKMAQDALSQAAHDPEKFEKLQRYFKDMQS